MTAATPHRSPPLVAEIVHEWRRSWRPGVAALVGGAVAYSVWPAVSSIFVEPLQSRYGWSRGDIAFAFNAGLISSLCAPLIGRAVDKFGVRFVLCAGLAALALCYVLFAAMPRRLNYYYGVFLAFSIVGLASTGISYTRVITGAFERTRGTALAIARSGLALSSALMPFLVFAVIGRWGIAFGYLTMAAFALLVALPLALLWIPPGRRESDESAATRETWRHLIRRPKILNVCAAATLNYAPVVALLTQMKPLAVSKGLDELMAVAAVSIIGIAAMGGALISGILVDRFWAPLVAFTLNLLPAIGCLLLLAHPVPPALFYAAVALVGLGQGAEIDIVAFIIARYFGLRSYASIYGLTVLCIGVGSAVAGSAIGALYDAFGSYDVPLICASISFASAALLYLSMGPYPPLGDADPSVGESSPAKSRDALGADSL